MNCTTAHCDTPLSNGITLCHDHTTRLEYDLAEVATVWEDLQVTLERMDVGADSIGGGPTGSRPALNLDAMDHGITLTEVLRGWASELAVVRPRLDPPGIASRLLCQIPQVRKADWAGELVRELQDSLNECRRATDRAADTISIGACGTVFEGIPCPGTMTAVSTATRARCRTCGATCDVRERQRDKINRAWHIQAPLPRIVRALHQSQHLTVPLETVKTWAKRGHLQPVAPGLFTPAAVLEAYASTPTGRRRHAHPQLAYLTE